MYSFTTFREYLESLLEKQVKLTMFVASTSRSYVVGKLTYIGGDFIFVEYPDQPKTAIPIAFIVMAEEDR